MRKAEQAVMAGHACMIADKGDLMPGSHLLQVCVRWRCAYCLVCITGCRNGLP